MNQRTVVGLALAGCVACALLDLVWPRRHAPAVPAGDVAQDLPARVAACPRPSLASLPQLAAGAAQHAATNPPAAPGAAPARLDEATLEPLRRAFVPPRFSEDPALPRERQTLLSNRLIVSPEQRSLPDAPSGRQSPTPRGTTPFIVLFNTPVSDAARALLTEAGALVRGFFPNNAILAELTPDALAALRDIAHVQGAAEFLPGDKVQPFLASLIAAFPKERTLRVSIQTLAPEDAAPLAAVVRKLDGEVEAASAGQRWGIVQAVLPLGAVAALAARGEVQWIEERPEIRHRNDKAVAASHLRAVPAWNDWGLTGKGQVVGHADTGLDTGVLATLHPDFAGRIRALIARGRSGDPSDPHGHGTHTAGSILGSGAASAGQFRGVAYEAELVHQSVVDAYGAFSGLPADLYWVYDESFALGAHIHSDSWGSSTYGAYDNDCRSTDLFAWNHPEHLAVFAACNDGRDTNSDGRTDSDSIGSPAAAKNVLTVGATENDRPAGSGGYSSYAWGTAWPSRYPAAPIKTDLISYSATPAPVYRQGMAAFSSRGPTDDGRIKPDVVAPGTDIISTKSSVGGNVWASYTPNSRYCFGGGTSMAAPLTAGAVALLRQYAVERAAITQPSAALLKAMVVGGARSLAPGQYGTDSTQEIPFASPNSVEGWGQPDVSSTVHPEGRMVRLFDRIGPAHGATNSFDVTVTVAGTPLDVALCWIDYPATAGAGITRVNDLDLLVIAPDGTPLHPNGGSARDSTNTVETVRVPDAQAGVYQIHVIGTAVPYTGGAAALYVRGAIEAAPVVVHTPLPPQTAGFAAYPALFQIQAVAPLTSGQARLFWAAGTGAAPTGTWQQTPAVWLSNAVYRADIPAMPPATHVHYYLRVDHTRGTVYLPQQAPAETFSFYVDNAVDLVVEGAPGRFGTVTPPYGTNTVIASVAFAASAPATVPVSAGIRRACDGWAGTGDVPEHGTGTSVTLSISQPSTLTWLWDAEYALTCRYRLADSGQLFDETVTWHRAGSAATTPTALELGFVGNTPYAFCGWSVDGARWPDAGSTSPNPAAGIPMHAPRLAQGDYLPYWQDTDGDGLSDWWELRYFGQATNSTQTVSDDPDNDNWTNLAEFLDNTDPNDPLSVPVPPEIAFMPLDPFQTARPPWTVTAVVTDNLNVEEVYLVWREKDDADWTFTPMAWVDADTYEAELTPPSHGAQRVDYAVYAADLIGYYFPQYASVSPTYSVIGDYPAPWLSVTPDALDLFELSETPTNLTLSVANLAGPDLVWTARLAVAAAPFQVTDGWTHGGVNDAWSVTTNRTWNGDAAWYCGNPSTRVYPNGCHAWLDTPPFTVGAGGGLIFRQWTRTEYDTGQDDHYWDGAVLRISTDGGATFSLIEPVGGYPFQITENPDSPFAPDHPCLAGDGQGWETVLLDLAAYAGQPVIVRFEFGSDLYVVDEGWYIANVTPFACDAPAPAWLSASGSWGGILPDTWSAPLGLTLDPAGLAYHQEDTACIRLTSNDPAPAPLIPLTVRRGHRLHLTAHGPGTVSADRTFLFRSSGATVTLAADPGHYLYSLLVNGVPQPGVYDYSTGHRVMTLSDVALDPFVDAWFTVKVWTLTVASTYGNASPAAGQYTFPHGALVTASVDPVKPLEESVRLQCSHWELTGHTASSGVPPQVSFTITNHAALTWHWAYACRLTALAGPGGTVAPAESWHLIGSTACVTSHPAAYHHFDAWSGDLAGATPDGPRLTALVSAPRTVSAAFAPNLTPTHGVPEYWLAQYGWTGDFDAAAASDSDQDGMAAWAEWRAGTDPTNALSRLAVTALAPQQPGGWSLTWIGGQDRTQRVERADAPAGPWSAVYTNLPPTAVTNTLLLPAAGPAGFYRLTVP
ncbi:MAG TPA: S8 family serine peptidase [Kiritimatiellia bacterium]|nr:S8 family serine peptidase [Kiritimatiellia bacterium]